jgi:hypothetical protein
MNGYLAQGGGSGGAGGAGARTGPAIPGLEQGTPQVGRPVAPAPPGTPVAGAQQGTQGTQIQTPQQLRDNLRKQIQDASRGRGDPQIIVPDNINFRNVVPQGAVDISVAFFVTVAVIIVGTPLARAFARRMDTQNAERLSGSRDIGPQIAQLQESVDAMAVELERITESQRFQSKLMAGKDAVPAQLQR